MRNNAKPMKAAVQTRPMGKSKQPDADAELPDPTLNTTDPLANDTPGRRITALRLQLGMTNRSDFARKVDVTTQTVINWEGGSVPDGETVVRVAALLGVTPNEIWLGNKAPAYTVDGGPTDADAINKIGHLSHDTAMNPTPQNLERYRNTIAGFLKGDGVFDVVRRKRPRD